MSRDFDISTKKLLIFSGLFIAAIGVCILIGMAIGKINDTYFTVNKDIKQGSNWNTKEIPGLDGIELGMSYDEVKHIEISNIESDGNEIDDSDYEDDRNIEYRFIESKEYAYTENSYYKIRVKIPNEDTFLGELIYIYFYFSDDKLVSLHISSSYEKCYPYYYNEITELFGEYQKRSGILYGGKNMVWETGNLYIKVSEPDSHYWDIEIYDIRYSPEEIEIIK